MDTEKKKKKEKKKEKTSAPDASPELSPHLLEQKTRVFCASDAPTYVSERLIAYEDVELLESLLN